CQEKGHYSNKCQNAAVPRGNKTRGGAVRGRGRDKAEAYYCKRVKDISNVVACTTVINNLTWYLDCACSDHVCSNKSVFSNFRVVKDAPLELGEGYSTVQGIGDIKLYTHVDGAENQITLKNMLPVCTFTFLTGLLPFIVAHIMIPYNAHIMFRGKLLVNDGLYELTSRTVPACTDNVHSQVIPSHKLEKLGGVVESNNFPSCNISVSAWHRRYAHMYVRGLKQLANNDDVKGIEFSSPVKDIKCDVCNISKSTRASYKSLENHFDDDVFEAEAQSDEDQNDEDLDVFGTPMKPGRRSEIEIEARNANRLVKIDSPLPMISEQVETPLHKNISSRKTRGPKLWKDTSNLPSTSRLTCILVPELPGWERVVKVRQGGVSAGDQDVEYWDELGFGPIRSYKKVQARCESRKIPYHKEYFDFSGRVKREEKPEFDDEMTDEDGRILSDNDEEYPFAVFEIKYSLTFLCQGKMADVFAPCYFNITQFKEDNAVLSDYNHSQAVVIDFEIAAATYLYMSLNVITICIVAKQHSSIKTIVFGYKSDWLYGTIKQYNCYYYFGVFPVLIEGRCNRMLPAPPTLGEAQCFCSDEPCRFALKTPRQHQVIAVLYSIHTAPSVPVPAPQRYKLRDQTVDMPFSPKKNLLFIRDEVSEHICNINQAHFILPQNQFCHLKHLSIMHNSFVTAIDISRQTFSRINTPKRPCKSNDEISNCEHRCYELILEKQAFTCRLPFMEQRNLALCMTQETAKTTHKIYLETQFKTNPQAHCSCDVRCQETIFNPSIIKSIYPGSATTLRYSVESDIREKIEEQEIISIL
uniref:Uncharacterized protein n=1 Tax=Strigamia maritima TaxID=126957 RepID=T1IGT8_STRMM